VLEAKIVVNVHLLVREGINVDPAIVFDHLAVNFNMALQAHLVMVHYLGVLAVYRAEVCLVIRHILEPAKTLIIFLIIKS